MAFNGEIISLDIFWLKDKSLADLDNQPEPDVLAEEIIENIEAGLNSFKEVLRLKIGGRTKITSRDHK